MPEFMPPAVPEGADIMAHVWATRQALQCWSPRKLDFKKLTLDEVFRFELLTHPRLQAINHKDINRMWGMDMEFVEQSMPYGTTRRYVITYQEV